METNRIFPFLYLLDRNGNITYWDDFYEKYYQEETLIKMMKNEINIIDELPSILQMEEIIENEQQQHQIEKQQETIENNLEIIFKW